ncbi:TPA: hypothetical protein L6726_001162 [Escherichia coli]|nr:hypothetical protein [Escherichia coli]ELY5917625.1 hypothetical protein [Cronobacter sakazakii]EFB3602610.1 hypothetical protein [Escherichia coli]EJH2454396.1 hypothetical protein [Escherichia coli]EKP1512685.1 hypothetical protein [Escherichia coli]
MPDETVLHRAGCSDALLNAQLAFALNGYSFDGLAERHRKTIHREAILRDVSTPLERYCLLNDCAPWECLAAVLNRMKRPDGSRLWKAARLSREVFNGRVHPVRKTPDEVYAAIARRLFLPKPVHLEVIQHIRALGLLPLNGDD